jgi:alpha-2-macroglobulin
MNKFKFTLILLLLFIFSCTSKKENKNKIVETNKVEKSRNAKMLSSVDPFTGLVTMVGNKKDKQFKIYDGPKPPERITKKMGEVFPPPKFDNIKNINYGELKVLKTTPKGKVKNIGALTIYFNQPMIPLTSLDEQRKIEIPIKINPLRKGKIKWLGTSVLAFEPEGRFPFSTKYEVTIPKGVKSSAGNSLNEDVKFDFTTPTTKLTSMYPSRRYKHAYLDTPLVLNFDQEVKSEDVLEKSILKSKNEKISLKVVPKDEWKNLKYYSPVSSKKKNRIVVLKPHRKLKKNTKYTFVIEKGLKSAEGPLIHNFVQKQSFKTYGPLIVKSMGCGWKGKHCRPGNSPYITFSNSLNYEIKLEEIIKITPKVKNLTFSNSGSYVYLYGDFSPATTYRIRIKKTIQDVYKQNLASNYNNKIVFLDYEPTLSMPGRKFGVIEKNRTTKLPVSGINNLRNSTITLIEINNKNLFSAIKTANNYYYSSYKKHSPSSKIEGKKITFHKKLNKRKNKNETSFIDLNRILNNKGGIVFIEIKSPDLIINKYSNPYRHMLVQVTNIGLTSKYDLNKIIYFATDLTKGTPLKGLKLKLFNRVKYKTSLKKIWEGESGIDGLAISGGYKKYTDQGPYIVLAEKKNDKSFLIIDGRGDDSNYVSNYGWYQRSLPKTNFLMAKIFTDRNPYKPGETVQITGILRSKKTGLESKINPLSGRNIRLAYTIKNPRYEKVKKGEVIVDEDGIFNIEFKTKEDFLLGNYHLNGTVSGVYNIETKYISHNFKIASYRVPEYKVKVDTGKTPYFYGDKFEGTISGEYTFGAPMKNSKVTWSLKRIKTNFIPPHSSGFHFGPYSRYSRWGWRRYRRNYSGITIQSGSGELDKEGKLKIEVELKEDEKNKASPGSYTLEAQVFDMNNQAISGSKTFVTHAGKFYTGIRTPKNVIKEGESIVIESIVLDIDGKRIKDREVEIKVIRNVWKSVKSIYQNVEEVAGSCKILSSNDIKSCSIKIKKAGSYKIKAEVSDLKNRINKSSKSFYVYGKTFVPWNKKDGKKLDLILDKNNYKPGEKIKLLIKNPFKKAVGLLTTEKNGILSHKRIKIMSSTHVEEILISDKDIPNFFISVILISGRDNSATGDSNDPGKPQFAYGSKNIPVSTEKKKIDVRIKLSKKVIKPGEEITININTKDYKNKPIRSRLIVMLVDEGVLSLMNFQTPDPLSFFYSNNSMLSTFEDIRNYLIEIKKKLKDKIAAVPTKPKSSILDNFSEEGSSNKEMNRPKSPGASGIGLDNVLASSIPSKRYSKSKKSRSSDRSKGSMRATFGARSAPTSILKFKVRKFFASTAYYNNKIKTDKNGKASLKIKMPENLTSFRVMVVAANTKIDGILNVDKYGKGDEKIKIRKKFMIRPSLPRFANFGDTFEAMVSVNNLTKNPGEATINIEGTGFKLLDSKQKTILVPVGETKTVIFKVKTLYPGRIRFRFSGYLGKNTDSIEPPPLKVNLPTSTEATATYGVTNGSVSQKIKAPKSALSIFGGIDVHLSSTALTGFQDAIRYLIDYPYGCAEQTASRLVPIFVLKDILKHFKIAKVSDLKKQQTIVNNGIKKLISYQKGNGGFSFWPSMYRSSPYLSTYITWALIRGYNSKYNIPEKVLKKAGRYLVHFLKYSNRYSNWGLYYSRTTKVMAVWVLSEMLKIDYMKNIISTSALLNILNSLYNEHAKLSLFAKSWMMVSFSRLKGDQSKIDELLRIINNASVQTAGGAHFAESTSEDLKLLLHSNSRSDSIILRALMEVDPKNVLIPKIVNALLKARIKGKWETTQSNAYALDSLSSYYKQYEKVVPDYSTHLWIGNGYMGTTKFKGRSMDIVHKKIKMKYLKEKGDSNLILSKKGKGKMYFRIGMVYVPKSLKLLPEEQGFSVKRIYEPIEEKDSVVRLKNGEWKVKIGKYIRVKLTIVVPDRRYYVAVDDPLPAGFEGVNMNFKTTASNYLQSKSSNLKQNPRGRFWYRYFYWYRNPNHKELRDDRYVLFWNRLPAGTYEYTYIVRSTTVGRFIVPPLKAHEMYNPEIFGRNGTQIVNVVK